MTINKVARAALKAISYNDIDVKKNLSLHRNFVNLTHKHYLKPFFVTWDFLMESENHTIPVRIYSPKEGGNYPVLLLFHGGGWVTGNIDSYSKVDAVVPRAID